MIVVDSSVWIDHLRQGESRLAAALESGLVLCHPFVIGELACGHLRSRQGLLASLAQLPAAPVAAHSEAMSFLERHALAGRGAGWVDVHLLASTSLAAGARLWTSDKRLCALAAELGLAYGSQAPPARIAHLSLAELDLGLSRRSSAEGRNGSGATRT